MADRSEALPAELHLPVRPHLGQLKRQAKELLRAVRAKDPEALEMLARHRPKNPALGDPGDARLADAQHALARAYGVRSWPCLQLACRLIEAICEDDVDTVRTLVRTHPYLLHENARAVESNWGPPMSYAANLGRDRVIEALRELGADDLQHAFDRACLQGRLDTARLLYRMGARPEPGAVMGPAETQNGPGMAFLLELGAEIRAAEGDRMAPVALVLQTYCRDPEGKHRCLELFAEHRIELPDTPPMAVHRGRIDLLERHLADDPALLSRTFAHREIYPPELGCHADDCPCQLLRPMDGKHDTRPPPSRRTHRPCHVVRHIDGEDPTRPRYLEAHTAPVRCCPAYRRRRSHTAPRRPRTSTGVEPRASIYSASWSPGTRSKWDRFRVRSARDRVRQIPAMR